MWIRFSFYLGGGRFSTHEDHIVWYIVKVIFVTIFADDCIQSDSMIYTLLHENIEIQFCEWSY
jgi:hypothetical protein